MVLTYGVGMLTVTFSDIDNSYIVRYGHRCINGYTRLGIENCDYSHKFKKHSFEKLRQAHNLCKKYGRQKLSDGFSPLDLFESYCM